MGRRKKQLGSPLTILIPKEDPLGYDTGDFLECAKAMAEDALAGRYKEAVEKEIGAAMKLLSRTRCSRLG